MALIFFDGFDAVQSWRKPEWEPGTDMRDQGGRGGGNGVSGNGSGGPQLNLPTDCASIYVGVGVNAGAGARGSTTAKLLQVGRATTAYLTVNLDASGHLLLRSGGPSGTILATGTSILTASTWTHLQLEVDVSSTAGAARVLLNGAVEIDYTGATAPTNDPINRLWLQTPDLWTIVWDDLYVCNETDASATQGRPNNTLLGDLTVAVLVPNGNGASSQLVGSDGNSVDNYLQADENRTDHYNGSATTGQRDTYALPNLPAGAVSVLAVRQRSLAWKSDAAAASLKLVLRESDGSEVVTSANALSTTAAAIHGPIYPTSVSGDAWTPTDVNGLQAGGEVG